MIHTATTAQHTLLAGLDRETKLAVARAYRARRRLGESDYPAYLAAVEAFREAVPGATDADAGQAVVLIIARASQLAPVWFWRAWVGSALICLIAARAHRPVSCLNYNR